MVKDIRGQPTKKDRSRPHLKRVNADRQHQRAASVHGEAGRRERARRDAHYRSRLANRILAELEKNPILDIIEVYPAVDTGQRVVYYLAKVKRENAGEFYVDIRDWRRRVFEAKENVERERGLDVMRFARTEVAAPGEVQAKIEVWLAKHQ